MKALIAIIAIALSTSAVAQFRLNGTVTGLPDSTLLYLDDLTEGSFKHIDSTYIINGKFSFAGRLNSSPMRAAIRTGDFEYRVYRWLENKNMEFKADKENFKNAVLTGSKTQIEADELNKLVEGAKDHKQIEYTYAKTHPSSIISAYILSVYNSTWGKDSTETLYKAFSSDIKKSYYGRQVAEYIELVKNVKIGSAYADFSQPDTKGKIRKLSELNGKVVLLEFWGSWCGPCRAGNPELVRIYNEYRDKGFEIFGVAAETSKNEWLEAIEKDKLPWINVTDLKGDRNKAAVMYNISYYPTNFLIDSKGIIVAKDLKGDKLRNKLKELLNP